MARGRRARRLAALRTVPLTYCAVCRVSFLVPTCNSAQDKKFGTPERELAGPADEVVDAAAKCWQIIDVSPHHALKVPAQTTDPILASFLIDQRLTTLRSLVFDGAVEL